MSVCGVGVRCRCVVLVCGVGMRCQCAVPVRGVGMRWSLLVAVILSSELGDQSNSGASPFVRGATSAGATLKFTR